ncbi:MAG TPA: UDP-N-acetylmuramoyl-L-alanyl-D-glutamate--2,6-diaminopimelate ligase [Acidimicrobiales bacterium]|nr:UDP-N-acetylmuramoyl-L-alanyl-D-glutamate--2,6-diaminopimelate ligase [Acidimicrobiales bacterium]
MNLLLDHIHVLEATGDPSAVEVRGVEHDSRRVRPGDLFVCLPGTQRDGHDYAAEAVARGAVAVVGERRVDLGPGPGVVQVRVAPGSARPSMGRLAAAFFGFPAADLLTAGVTGTNGKTTVTHLLAAVFEAAGRPATVIGTLSGVRTTPESTELQALLAEVRDRGRADGTRPSVAMEVSSHALAQARVEGVVFDVVAFTNLSHDHLDYHGTMASYFEAKATLFTPEHARRAVVWVGDDWGRRLADTTTLPVVRVGRPDASGVELAWGRSRLVWRGREIVLELTGRVNVDNALVAAESAVSVGIDPDVVATGLGRARPVPGRLELVTVAPTPVPITVVVDYAHTPSALEALMTQARELSGGRVIVVFGAGGDRDPMKRPEMGEVAGRLADVVVLTSDNPRHEDPRAVIAEVRSGMTAGRPPLVVADRAEAIAAAVATAAPSDVVVIAGKGHETTQEIGGRTVDFDDRVQARAALADRFGGPVADGVATGPER